jgi:ubiquinone/menaquinone biosynthesis C-methylase UbiE
VKLRYDLTAHIYDMRYEKEQTAKIRAAMESINLENESLVLDVGCGTGLLFNHVAGKAKVIVGLDISGKILLQAKECAKKLPNVHLILADADNMPLNEDVFSHLFAVTLIQNMPSPFRTLDEVKRVTRENAFMVITGLKKKFPTEVFEKLLEDAGLNVLALVSEGLKCYVAVCTKFLH